MLWTNIMLTWCQLQLPSTGICWSVKPKQDLIYIRHSGDPVPRCTQGSQKTPDVNFFVHSALWVVSIDFATDWCDLFVTFSPGPEGQRDWMHLDLCIWTIVGSKMSCKQWSKRSDQHGLRSGCYVLQMKQAARPYGQFVLCQAASLNDRSWQVLTSDISVDRFALNFQMCWSLLEVPQVWDGTWKPVLFASLLRRSRFCHVRRRAESQVI